MDHKSEVYRKLIQHYNKLKDFGYNVVYLSLYGSQNYGLDLYSPEYWSDVDTKAVIIPNLDDLVYNSKPISTTLEIGDGLCDIKDIRIFFDILVKVNPSYVETLYSDFCLINSDYKSEIESVLGYKDKLVYNLRAKFCESMYGMMCEKEKALTYPYPSIINKIEKYGCDQKQLHHIIRLYLMMEDYFLKGYNLKDCFYPKEEMIPLLIKCKLSQFSLEEALSLTSEYMEKGKILKESIISNINESDIDNSIKENVLQLSRDIIKKKIVQDIKSN